MAEQLSPGVQFTEPASGTVPIQGASTSIAGFLGIAAQGPLSQPTLLNGMGDYDAIFGTADAAGSYLRTSVKGFFDNGGTSCYVSRVAHYTTITDRTSFDTVYAALQLKGDGAVNDMLLNASSPGAWGNSVAVSTTRQDTIITTSAQASGIVAITSLALTSVARVYIGQQLRLDDGVNQMRVVVTGINAAANTITFASTTPPANIATTSNIFQEEFDISVYLNGLFNERIKGLAMSSLASNYFLSVINNGNPKRYILVKTDNAQAATNTVDPRPTNVTLSTLTGGTDGTTPSDADFVGAASGNSAGPGTGLYAFDIINDVNLMAAPGRVSATFHQGLIAYVEGRGDLFAIMGTNSGLTPSQAVTYVQTTANLYSQYAAIYYPWLYKANSQGVKTLYPSEGDVAGVYARTDTNRGVQKAPAGTPDGQLQNVLGPEVDLKQADRDLLYPAAINMFRSLPGKGTVVWGSRTLAQGSQFGQIPVRRVFNFVKRSLKEGTYWVVFEENGPDLWAKVRKTVGAFLLRQWRGGLLKGDKAQDAFFVRCDSTNNQPSAVDAGQLVCQIGLAVFKPAEFITFQLVQDTRALDAELASAGIS